MGVGSGGAGGGRGSLLIFIHGTNIVDRGFFGHFLLFFGLFSVAPPLKFFLPTPLFVFANYYTRICRTEFWKNEIKIQIEKSRSFFAAS